MLKCITWNKLAVREQNQLEILILNWFPIMEMSNGQFKINRWPVWKRTLTIPYLMHYICIRSILHTFWSQMNNFPKWWPGPWFNIKMSSYQYRKSHSGDKMILRPSYLHNGISYTGKMTYLYWIRAQVHNRLWGINSQLITCTKWQSETKSSLSHTFTTEDFFLMVPRHRTNYIYCSQCEWQPH